MRPATQIVLLLSIACAASCANHPDLALMLQFDSPPASDVMEAMREELAAVLSPTQLHLQWVALDGNTGGLSYTRAVIVHFHGACAAQPGSNEEFTARPRLASTELVSGQISNSTDVDCDLTRGFLPADFRPGANRRMGMVLARLMAHEIYHVLLNTREHSASGLGKARQTPHALLQKTVRFEHGELERIRDSFARR